MLIESRDTVLIAVLRYSIHLWTVTIVYCFFLVCRHEPRAELVYLVIYVPSLSSFGQR